MVEISPNALGFGIALAERSVAARLTSPSQMVELLRLLAFVADDGTLAVTAVMAAILLALWVLAISICVRLITCIERVTHCHHHEDVRTIQRQLRESLREECKDFCLRVASSNASGQRITRSVALQHAFDAFSGSSSGFVKDAKVDVHPELWAPVMRSLAIDVLIEQNRERGVLIARCAKLLDAVCQSSQLGSEVGETAQHPGVRIRTRPSSDDAGDVAWEEARAEEDGAEEDGVATTLLQLVAWSNCGCLRRRMCSECGASDFTWVGHSSDKMAGRAGSVGGHCRDILPLRTQPVDDDLSPRYCAICRKQREDSTRLKSTGDRDKGKVD